MPRGKKNSGVSKRDAVLQALTALGSDAMPVAIQGYAKDKLGMNIPTTTISNYKGELAKKNGVAKEGGKKKAKVTSAPAAVIAAPKKAASTSSHGFTSEDIKAMRLLVEKLGAGGANELVKALA